MMEILGTPGAPWGADERLVWRSRTTVRRTYVDDVERRMARLGDHYDIVPYGHIASTSDGDAPFTLLAARTRSWSDDRPVVLVTGGVHGYETSGVIGALTFLEEHCESPADDVDVIVVPCVSPWSYERIQRWNANADDPNRSFVANTRVPEAAALMALVGPFAHRVLLHLDLHETTDTDETEFRPALAARDGYILEPGTIPDGFYLCGDTEAPQLDFQAAVIAAVADVTHIAAADANNEIIETPVAAPGVILYPMRSLGLAGAITDAPYRTLTEVYPDSVRATPTECVAAQVAAVRAAMAFALGSLRSPQDAISATRIDGRRGQGGRRT